MGYAHGTKWTYELAKQRIVECKEQLRLDRMPTHVEMKIVKWLSSIIQKKKWYEVIRGELGLEKKCNTRYWDYSKVEKEIMTCIKGLDLDRMPTHKEIKEFYDDHGLACALSKNTEWKKRFMKENDFKMRKSETTIGWKYEEIAWKMLIEKGYEVERMTTGQHFDLLVNDNVKIDVKAGRRWYMDKCQANSFGINKKYGTCDIYMMFALDDNDEIDKILIIPSIKVRSTTMTIGKDSKYDIWKDKFDVIKKYSDFLNEF